MKRLWFVAVLLLVMGLCGCGPPDIRDAGGETIGYTWSQGYEGGPRMELHKGCKADCISFAGPDGRDFALFLTNGSIWLRSTTDAGDDQEWRQVAIVTD